MRTRGDYAAQSGSAPHVVHGCFPPREHGMAGARVKLVASPDRGGMDDASKHTG